MELGIVQHLFETCIIEKHLLALGRLPADVQQSREWCLFTDGVPLDVGLSEVELLVAVLEAQISFGLTDTIKCHLLT